MTLIISDLYLSSCVAFDLAIICEVTVEPWTLQTSN